jgi:hypothetical protein
VQLKISSNSEYRLIQYRLGEAGLCSQVIYTAWDASWLWLSRKKRLVRQRVYHVSHVRLIKDCLKERTPRDMGPLQGCASTTYDAMRQGLILPSGNADPGPLTGHDDCAHQFDW